MELRYLIAKFGGVWDCVWRMIIGTSSILHFVVILVNCVSDSIDDLTKGNKGMDCCV